jgi:hypothetical protein
MADPPSPVTQDDGTDKKVPVVPVQLGYHTDCINRYICTGYVLYTAVCTGKNCALFCLRPFFPLRVASIAVKISKSTPWPFLNTYYILLLNCSSQLFN